MILASGASEIHRETDNQAKQQYMKALHLNERERTVIYEGGYIIGKEEGRAEGLAEGCAKTRLLAAQSFLKEGIPLETVARVLSLSEEEVEALKGA